MKPDLKIDAEIAWRKELIKRLEYPLHQLMRAWDKEIEKANKRIQELAKYESYEDAQTAYGYEEITMAELERLEKLFNGEQEEHEPTTIEIAANELKEYIFRLYSDIKSLNWEKLTPEECHRIEMETEERHARHEARKLSY
jgi:hypothetical protein